MKTKILNGEPNQDRLNYNEPQPKPGRTTAPAILKGAALSEWRRIYSILEGMQIMTQADRAILAAYCLVWGTIVDVQRQINKLQDAAIKAGKDPSNAYLIKGEEKIYLNPLMRIRSNSLAELNTFAAKLGLSPSDRGKIEMPEQKMEDEFEKFLQDNRVN
jgi:P27 family predicted phage terminase small subunit